MTGVDALGELLPSNVARFGLGCSRLGSVGGATKDDARTLLRTALAEGVRIFDTSNIYGQGDSERLIGEVLRGRSDCVIVSKAGKYFPWRRRMLTPLKGLLRLAVRRSRSARQGVASARSRPMPTRWDSAFLTRSLKFSLKRLGRDHVEIFMLHSPSVKVILSGTAIAALDRARVAGKIGMVGVSVDDVETARACLDDPRIQVLQLPLRPGDPTYDEVLESAQTAGVAVIAREILGGPGNTAMRGDSAAFASQSIVSAVRNPMISVVLVGATRISSLTSSLAAVRAAAAGEA